MPPKLKTALKALAYIAFFLAALVLFVVLTLPLDALEDYLVRKASDEYGADLEITELSMWGLSGLEFEGVTLTPRPSPEEIAEIRAAREARAAWEARQKEKAAAAEGEGAAGAGAAGEKAGAAAAPSDPAAALAAAARAARTTDGEGTGDPTEGGEATDGEAVGAPAAGDGAMKARAARAARVAAAAVKPADDKPPPVPSGPQPLFVESLRVRVALLKLIGDLSDGQVFNEAGEVELEAEVLGGSISARVERTVEHFDITASFRGLDLSRLTVLGEVLPLPIVGGFDGEVDLEVPVDDAGRPRLASTTGQISLTMSDAVIGPGRIESDSLRNVGGFFDVPRLRLTSFGGKIAFEQRRASFEDFAFRGQDLEGDLSGELQLANSVEQFAPRAYLRFKFSDDFLEREKGIGVLMRTVPEIKRGTGGDGFTGFAVTKNARTQRLAWRPTPRNPYGARGASPSPPARATPSARPGRARIPRPTSRPPRTRPSAPEPALDEVTKGEETVIEEAVPEEPVELPSDEGGEGGEGEE
ncbi:MAG: type II secretion system protein GspN [Myxococcales bacterium]|nr:type II secretion system protein GspN [Myxococcales bacterium]